MLFSMDNLQKKQTPNSGSDPYWKRNPFNTYTEFIVDYILHSIAFFGRLLFFDWLKLHANLSKEGELYLGSAGSRALEKEEKEEG